MVKKSTVMGENMIKTLLWSGWESKFDIFPVNINFSRYQCCSGYIQDRILYRTDYRSSYV